MYHLEPERPDQTIYRCFENFIDALSVNSKVQPQIITTTRYSKSVNPWRDIAEEMNRLFSLLY